MFKYFVSYTASVGSTSGVDGFTVIDCEDRVMTFDDCISLCNRITKSLTKEHNTRVSDVIIVSINLLYDPDLYKSDNKLDSVRN